MATSNFQVAAVVSCVLLQACTMSPPAQPASNLPPPPAMPTVCDAAGAQFAVGRSFDSPLAEEARQRSSSQTVRALRPGQAVTMEFSANRLNLELDASGRVTQVRCG